MAWDDDKSTAADPENPTADEQLSADEWDAHVADQKGHASRHEKGGGDELVTFGDTVHDSIETENVSNVVYIGDSSTPNADINAAPAGSTILCDPSTPIQTDGLFNIDVADLTIYGLNLALNDAANNNVLQVRADGVTLVDPVVDGNKANQSPGSQIHGIFTVGQADVTLVRPVVTDTYDNGITNFAPDATNQTIIGGRVINAGREGIRMGGEDLTVDGAYIENAGSRVQAGGAVPRDGENQYWNVTVDTTTDSGITVTGSAHGAVIRGESRNNANNGLETEDSAVVDNITVSDFEAYGNGSHGAQIRCPVVAEGFDLHDNDEAGLKLNGQDGAIDFCEISGQMWNNGQATSPAEPYGVTGTGTVTDVILNVVCYDRQGTPTQTTGVNTVGSCDYWDLAHSNLRDMATPTNLVGANNSTGDATL